MHNLCDWYYFENRNDSSQHTVIAVSLYVYLFVIKTNIFYTLAVHQIQKIRVVASWTSVYRHLPHDFWKFSTSFLFRGINVNHFWLCCFYWLNTCSMSVIKKKTSINTGYIIIIMWINILIQFTSTNYYLLLS